MSRPKSIFCARNATMLIGMEFSAAFMRRTCARKCGANSCAPKPCSTISPGGGAMNCASNRLIAMRTVPKSFYVTTAGYGRVAGANGRRHGDGARFPSEWRHPGELHAAPASRPYHRRLREASSGGSGQVGSIHDQLRSKEEDLQRFLRYDRWPRNAFRLLLFSSDKTFNDYRELKLDEHAALASGAYRILETASGYISLECDAPCPDCAPVGGSIELIRCTKRFSFASERAGYRLDCTSMLSCPNAQACPAMVGVEIVLNFLAPREADRYFEISSRRHPLAWSAAVSAAENGSRLRVVDEWQNVAATIEAPSAREFWIAPIETISESEEWF